MPETVARYVLNPSVFACQVPEGVILLDIRRDKYFALHDALTDMLGTLVVDWPIPANAHQGYTDSVNREVQDLCAALTSEGVLSPLDPKLPAAPRTQCGRTVALKHYDPDYAGPLPAIRFSHVARFASAHIRALIVLKLLSLNAAVSHVKSVKRRLRGDDSRLSDSTTLHLVQVFRRIRPFFYTRKDRCLLDGFTLALFLLSYKRSPELVIGVRTDPFSAHCWVQLGDVAFDSNPEDVACFTPILTI